MSIIRMLSRATLVAATAISMIQPSTAQERVARVVMNNELQSLDPVVTISVVTRTFGYFVWDTLVAEDAQGNLRPQMLEGWESSEDGLTWRFKLRPGLLWSDGGSVTAEDCVASLRRWGARDGLGRQLMAATSSLTATGPDTFVLQLSRPFGQVLQALGKSATYAPFIMPARIAATSPSTQITEIIGSGPFTFDRNEWRPGDRAIFRRNSLYRPRAEPASGMAGGKIVHFDRVDMVSIGDSSTRVAALQKGEIDALERVPLDFVEVLRANRHVVVTPGLGRSQIFGVLTLNHTQPPFNNIEIRRALQQAISQVEIGAGLGLPADMYKATCLAIFMCGGPYDNDAGTERFSGRSLERAQAMLRASGYRNEPIVVLHSSDSALINPISLVAIEQMRRVGFNVDMRASDWSSVAQLRTRRSPVAEGGWSVVPLVWTGFDMENPLANPAVVHSCAETYPGWYCNPEQQPLLRRFAAATSQEERQAIARELQRTTHDNVNVIILSQFSGPAAYRADLQDVLDVGFPVMWNMRRAERR